MINLEIDSIVDLTIKQKYKLMGELLLEVYDTQMSPDLWDRIGKALELEDNDRD